jgi:murein DD-endopeptidase MepM/ murein hydrolase activator NlpD
MIIKSKNGLTEKYAHMRKFLVKPGDVVPAGGVIGMVGSTGRTRSSHLHFSIYEKKGWNKSDHLDPKSFICKYPVFTLDPKSFICKYPVFTLPHNHTH